MIIKEYYDKLTNRSAKYSTKGNEETRELNDYTNMWSFTAKMSKTRYSFFCLLNEDHLELGCKNFLPGTGVLPAMYTGVGAGGGGGQVGGYVAYHSVQKCPSHCGMLNPPPPREMICTYVHTPNLMHTNLCVSMCFAPLATDVLNDTTQ